MLTFDLGPLLSVSSNTRSLFCLLKTDTVKLPKYNLKEVPLKTHLNKLLEEDSGYGRVGY